jgi:diaminohydroxyphosphoribosylaminopyrimidine deaminase/5-amino-6-(5-phosphoribosylamino)uracil reductase
MVGALLVKDGRLLAEAWHARYGGPHAEAAALRRAGRSARGATLYVSLEPCAHQGKTPPCTRAVIEAGVIRVVAAMRDPHPLVNGRGLRELRRAGIEVSTGLMRRDAALLNEAYLIAIIEGRPSVTLKAGMTLDGKIAPASGSARWITSPASRRDGHRLRAAHDAVLVGIGTAIADSPRLDARGAGAGIRQPLRAVLDSALRLDPASSLLKVRGGGGIVVYTARPHPARARLLERRGATVVVAGAGEGGVSLPGALRDLVSRGVHSLLVEGGSAIAWSFLAAGLVDRIVLYMAPMILGGRSAVPLVGDPGFGSLVRALRLTDLKAEGSGPDLRLTARIPRKVPIGAGLRRGGR